jgi:hypothetical protein
MLMGYILLFIKGLSKPKLIFFQEEVAIISIDNFTILTLLPSFQKLSTLGMLEPLALDLRNTPSVMMSDRYPSLHTRLSVLSQLFSALFFESGIKEPPVLG